MIKVEHLEMLYGNFKALNDVSFQVNQGEVVGLLGPNGAGKSTTMKILTTFLHPTAGKAEIDGVDVTVDPITVRSKIGYLPEILPLYLDMEVKDYLYFVAKARALEGNLLKERVNWVVDKCALRPMYRKLCRELSKGYRQRVGIAQALVHDPEIVILDEPTSGLDPHQIKEIRALIRTLGKDKTVILSTHVLQEAEAVSDRIVIINRGSIVGDGTLVDLQKRAHPNEKILFSAYGDREALESGIKAVDSCKELTYLTEEGGYHNFELTTESGKKLCTTLGELAKTNQWQIGLLKDVPYSLEETFMALTEGGSKK